MITRCNFYHKQKLTVIPGTEADRRVVDKLCPSCRDRCEKEANEYVEKLYRHFNTAPQFAVSGR